ncbi:hypothetical protein RBH29_05675 [Herbivorax sp. ANBcel31]|uniref:hypothetical protein n=1 Tax=Herbivorax sp. ANBcel31 TaxID=3069754 RepID=UPI0027B76FC9|nr:hypothetical protein [Herbivorax sp. ANBcel31]MDQ2085927.1 hypothetical protein [Herbivorax sp. ANBcel31]
MANNVLVEEYNKPENQSIILLDNLNEDEIGFDSFDGKSLGRLAFGLPLEDSNTPFYESFLTQNGGGGLIIMTWSMLCFIIMGILSILRYGCVGILDGLSSLWIAHCAWAGDETPAIGYINLLTRSIVLSYIFDLAWLEAYFVIHNPWDFEGIGSEILACILFTIAIAVSVSFWLRWFYRAVKQPFW